MTVLPTRPPGRKPIYRRYRQIDFSADSKPRRSGWCSYPGCSKRPVWARLGGTANLAYCHAHAVSSGWPVRARTDVIPAEPPPKQRGNLVQRIFRRGGR
jgi:hypothetical protein